MSIKRLNLGWGRGWVIHFSDKMWVTKFEWQNLWGTQCAQSNFKPQIEKYPPKKFLDWGLAAIPSHDVENKILLDFCKQSLNWLVRPPIHPSFHPPTHASDIFSIPNVQSTHQDFLLALWHVCGKTDFIII